MCSNWTLTFNFVRGQLEPLLCNHHTTEQRKQSHWPPPLGTFYPDLVDLSVGILGDAFNGNQQAMITDLLGTLDSEELSLLASSAEVCSFGPATGLARTSQCLSAVSTFPSPLRLQRPTADSLLRNLESTRPGTEIVFHSTIGYKPHRLDQDVRRQRLRFLQNHYFGKVAMISGVHFRHH